MLLISRSLNTLRKMIIILFPLCTCENRGKARWWGLLHLTNLANGKMFQWAWWNTEQGSRAAVKSQSLDVFRTQLDQTSATCSNCEGSPAFGPRLDQISCNQYHARLLISETGMTLSFQNPSALFGLYYVMQGKFIFSIRKGKFNLFLAHFILPEQYGRGLENKVTIAASSMSIHFLIVSAKLV